VGRYPKVLRNHLLLLLCRNKHLHPLLVYTGPGLEVCQYHQADLIHLIPRAARSEHGGADRLINHFLSKGYLYEADGIRLTNGE
jgi:hypothetical protein